MDCVPIHSFRFCVASPHLQYVCVRRWFNKITNNTTRVLFHVLSAVERSSEKEREEVERGSREKRHPTQSRLPGGCDW